MKNILIIHTGGTIGSLATENSRRMSKETVTEARRFLIEEFATGNSAYAEHSQKLIDSNYCWENTTLSESMSFEKLSTLINYINGIAFSDYAGIIVLHGTDTLAYTAALLSFAFSKINIPLFLVSGNRPPHDKLSNANDNFKSAIELIWGGIAPNVYVTYRNSDGIMRLYLASCIMQSENYSEDFRGVENKFFMLSTKKDFSFAIKACNSFLQKRKSVPIINNLLQKVLFIKPYTGIDYSLYKNIFTETDIKAVVHGSYHSGTVSYPGLVFKTEAQNTPQKSEYYNKLALKEANSKYSVKYLCDICKTNNIPVFIAPSSLSSDQYETMNYVADNTHATLLNMTAEAAYMKAVIALSCKVTDITEFMQTEINNEFN